MTSQEAMLTAGTRIEAGKRYGFFTDTSLCIGCKACEVACKEWNALPADDVGLTGHSYDNTSMLSATTWRHVAFVEQIGGDGRRMADGGRRAQDGGPDGRVTVMPPFQSNWLMMSDVCKHCAHAACLEACPTGALFYTEFHTVVVQQDICNGCGYCVPACPFGVVELDQFDGKAHKCTLCYDRAKGGLEPACAKACPTDSIQFGEVGELQARARRRAGDLHQKGVAAAYLYGLPDGPGATGGIGELNAFFLLLDRPEVYNLPPAPVLPSTRVKPGFIAGLLAMAGLVGAGVGERLQPRARAPAQLVELAELDRVGWASLRAGRFLVILEAVVAERALPHAPVLLALVEDAEGARGNAVAAAVADVLLHDHGPELGAKQRAGGAYLQAGRIGAVLAHVGGHQPAQALAVLIGAKAGLLDELVERRRLHELAAVGVQAHLLALLDDPEVYGLPPDPVDATRDLTSSWGSAAAAAAGLAAALAAAVFGGRR